MAFPQPGVEAIRHDMVRIRGLPRDADTVQFSDPAFEHDTVRQLPQITGWGIGTIVAADAK
jgi:hypothetical protein